jgi:hypothetical protein
MTVAASRGVMRAAIALAVLTLTVPATMAGPTAAHAAPLPDAWCGTDAASADRPDTVAGNQVHVVYARPSNEPDRFAEIANAIARDLAGVDAWWQGQDPTRAPRFDLAAFPGCASEFGALDVSNVVLDGDSAAFDVDDPVFGTRVGESLVRAGLDDATKKYFVYYDGPGSQAICGISATSPFTGGALTPSFVFVRAIPGCTAGGGLGTGNAWPARTAAHELVHALNAVLTPDGAPHGCEDHGHVCDSVADVISTGTEHPSAFLSDAVLDVGHDDYYDHPGTWWDVRDSPWLSHRERSTAVLTARIDAGVGFGELQLAPYGARCADACALRYDGDLVVRVRAVPRPGYRLLQWRGACSGSGAHCDVIMAGGPAEVGATFGRAVVVRVQSRGPGRIVQTDGTECARTCRWDLVPGAPVELRAHASPGARFVGWHGLCAGAGRACVVAVTLAAYEPTTAAVFRPNARGRARSAASGNTP